MSPPEHSSARGRARPDVPVDELVVSPTGRFDDAVKWSFGMNVVRLGATLGTTFVLASLLGPGRYGVVALALIFIGLLQLVMQQGMIPAIVQRPGLTHRHLDSAFWLTMVAGVVVAGLGLLSSTWWARLNDAPQAASVIRALSVLIVVKGMVVVQEALLRRQMQFRELAIRTTAASFAGAVVGLSWALVDASVWALVAQQLTTEIVGGAVLWKVSGWRPRLRFWPTEARSLVPFASKASLSSFGVFVNNRVDALLVGLFFGPTAVGIYRLASRLVESAIEITIQPVQNVSLPEFARYQHDRTVAIDRYRSLVVLAASVGGVVMASVFATARPLLATVGDEWTPGVAALQWLCVVGLVRAMTMLNGPAVQAAGFAGLQAAMTWTAATLSALGFLVAGLLLTDSDLGDQVVGMASSRAALYVVLLLPIGQSWLIRRTVGVTGREYVRLVAEPLAVSSLAGGAGVAAAHLSSSLGVPDVVSVGLVGAVTAGLGIAGLVWRVSVFRSAVASVLARRTRRRAHG